MKCLLKKQIGCFGFALFCLVSAAFAGEPANIPSTKPQPPASSPDQLQTAQASAEEHVRDLEDKNQLVKNTADVKVELNEKGFVKTAYLNGQRFDFSYSESLAGETQKITISSEGDSIVLENPDPEIKPESWKAALKSFGPAHNHGLSLSLKTDKRSFKQIMRSLDASSSKNDPKSAASLKESLQNFSKYYTELESEIKPGLSADPSGLDLASLKNKIKGLVEDLKRSLILNGRSEMQENSDDSVEVVIILP